MKRKLSLLTLLMFIAVSVLSQQKAPGLPEIENLQDFYRTGVGARIGWPVAALTVKHFITRRRALEFIGEPRFGGGSLTILAEKHVPARRPAIYWYYGAGVNAGIFRSSIYKDYDGDVYEGNEIVSLGVNIVLGIEMNIHETPFSVSFDVKPRIGIYNPGGSIMEGAVGLKYIWSR